MELIPYHPACQNFEQKAACVGIAWSTKQFQRHVTRQHSVIARWGASWQNSEKR